MHVKCVICGNSGHWEDRCDIVKINGEKLKVIETELEKLEISRRTVIKQYQCKINLILECLITQVNLYNGLWSLGPNIKANLVKW